MSEEHENLRDPVGDYLGRRLPTVRQRGPARVFPTWKPSVPRILGLCLGALVLAGSGALVLHVGSLLRSPPACGAGGTDTPHAPVSSSPAAGRVVLVVGGVALHRGEESRLLSVGDVVRGGDVLDSGARGSVGIDLESGHTMVLEGRARIEMHERIAVTLVRGSLAASCADPRQPLIVSGSNASVVIGRSAVTVEAEEGLIERVTVVQGEARIAARDRVEPEHILHASESLDVATWRTSASGSPAAVIERLAFLHPVESTDSLPAPVSREETPPTPPPPAGPSPASLIRSALEAGDVDEAVRIARAGGKGSGFLLASADAYRQAGLWDEATTTYVEASAVSEGKKAERALLRAADIALRKLDDPGRAGEILAIYMQRFPGGTYHDEALYLSGSAHTNLGEWKLARADFEAYLQEHPDGPQCLRVHLTLARILAHRLSDCPAALVHVDAIRESTDSPTVLDQLLPIEALCSGAGSVAP